MCWTPWITKGVSKPSAQITAFRRRMSGAVATIRIHVQMFSIIVVTERILTRGKWRSVEVLACPATFSMQPEHIEAARRAYDDWWRALDWNPDGLITGGMLWEVEVTRIMPRRARGND